MANLALDQAQAPLANLDVPALPLTRLHKLRNLVYPHLSHTSKASVRTPVTLNRWARLRSMAAVLEDSVVTQPVELRATKQASMVLMVPDLATTTPTDRMVDAVVAGAETMATKPYQQQYDGD